MCTGNGRCAWARVAQERDAAEGGLPGGGRPARHQLETLRRWVIEQEVEAGRGSRRRTQWASGPALAEADPGRAQRA